MIDPITEILVRELLKHGTSQRAIAKQLGIARNTVSKIVGGSDIRPSPVKNSSHERYLPKIKELFQLSRAMLFGCRRNSWLDMR